MNYEQHYRRLIERAQSRVYEGYTETHHIRPKCMGGTDSKANLVELTPEEHYVAHQLLVKIYPNNSKLIKAAQMMVPNRPSNKLYGWVRRRYAKAVSEDQQGKGNSQYGTQWIHNKTLRENQKIAATEPVPEGWRKGRVIDFNRPQKDPNFNYKEAAYDRQRREAQQLAQELFDKFISSSYNSVTAFAKANNTSQPRLSALWKKHVPEFNQNRQQGRSFKKGL